jgi:Ca-activated chloride channel family protein
MRQTAFALLVLALAFSAPAQQPEPEKPITINVEPLGDNDTGDVVTRVSFHFPGAPDEASEIAMYLQGSFLQGGKVLRNFRYIVPPDMHGSFSAVQSFAAGEVEVEARLILPIDESAPLMLAKTSQKFTVAKTGKPYTAAKDDGAEGVLAEGVLPEALGAVKIRSPRRDVALNLFIVDVDTLPPVKRVEYWVDGKKVMARNNPPFRAELDLGKLPKRVEVKVIGYDDRGRYVDADAFVVNERDTPLEVKITRTETPDGVSHFKLSVQNPKNVGIKAVELFAGDKKLASWQHPPYAIDIPTARLGGVEFVRASALDDTGYEAADLLFLSGDRYIEQIEVNLVELPVSVTDPSGAPITDLKQENFKILESGKPQKLTSFNYATDLPISVGVLLDHSGSMKERMADARGAGAEFFRRIMRGGDRAFIAPFASDPSKFAPFVSDVATLEEQVKAIPDAEGGTALYDAIVTGLYRFRNIQGRKALIVISDGEDTTSRLTYDDMLTYARASRVPLYFIGIGFSVLGGGGSMKSLAAETGGVTYFIKNAKQLPEAYRKLENELRTQYMLSYYAESTTKDQTYRPVEVQVDRANAKVRTIRGYIP